MVRKLAGFLLFFFFNFFYFFSQEISVELSTEKSEVLISEEFIISLNITSDTDNIAIEEYPKLDSSININSVGQSKSFNILATGSGIKKNVSMNFQYLCRINKSGTYSIGPFVVGSKGKKFNSNILNITVVESSKTPGVKRELDSKEIDSDRNNFYIIRVEPSKTTVFENEFFDVEVVLYSYRGYDFRIRDVKKLNYPKNSWVENTLLKDNATLKRVMINNEIYQGIILEKERVYISREGEYRIEPFEITFDGIVSRDFFALPESIYLKTKPVTITVKPLPKDGKDFKGAVGSFKISWDILPKELEENEAATLSITMEGEGNFHNIDEIKYYLDKSFDVYSTKSNIFTNDNIYKVKKWETIIVPTRSGRFDIKINDFIYFSPSENRFKTISLGKTTVLVKNRKGDIATNNTQRSYKDTSLLTKKSSDNKDAIDFSDISFLKLNIGNKNFNFLYLLFFYSQFGLYIIFLIGVIFTFGSKYVMYLSEKNENLNKDKTALKKFLLRISKINFVKRDKHAILDEISHSVEAYFTDKFGIKPLDFTKKNIELKLKGILSDNDINSFNDLIMSLNMARFGEKKLDIKEIEDLSKNIKRLIKFIDEKVKK